MSGDFSKLLYGRQTVLVGNRDRLPIWRSYFFAKTRDLRHEEGKGCCLFSWCQGGDRIRQMGVGDENSSLLFTPLDPYSLLSSGDRRNNLRAQGYQLETNEVLPTRRRRSH